MVNRLGYFDLIRRLVREDYDGYAARCELLDETGWEGLGLVVGAAFYNAVNRRFSSEYDVAKVIRFVADLRADIAGAGFEVEPLVAERLLRAALTSHTELVDNVSPGNIVETELLVLWKLLGPLSETELTDFFAEADALADRWSR